MKSIMDADKTGDTKSLLSTVRHENQHAIDKANGVDYETYSKDKDGYEDLAKKSSTEFLNSYQREFDDSPSSTATETFIKMDAGTNGAETVKEIMPWTLQVGVSGSGGTGAGATYGKGYIISYDENDGFQFGKYRTTGGGGHAGVTITGNLDITFSDNDHIMDLSGKSGVVGGSIETNVPFIPSAGYEVNINDKAKSSHTFSIGKGGSLTFFELHGYVTDTKIEKTEPEFVNKLNELLGH